MTETEETVLDLLPCPFCGCARIYERGFRCFECPECRAEGPTKATKAEAVAAWNTRAALSRAPGAGREGAAERLAIVAEKPAHLIRWGEGDRLDLQSVLAALSPPSTGGEDREEIARDLEQAWQVLPVDNARAVEARSIIRSAISKLKENGLSREELGGLARSLPSGDAQERSPVPPLSDGWQDISTAPKDGQDVLIWNDEGAEIARWYPHEEDGSDQPGHDEGWIGIFAFPGRSWGHRLRSEPQGQPSHWMPLPSPPEQGEG